MSDFWHDKEPSTEESNKQFWVIMVIVTLLLTLWLTSQ